MSNRIPTTTKRALSRRLGLLFSNGSMLGAWGLGFRGLGFRGSGFR